MDDREHVLGEVDAEIKKLPKPKAPGKGPGGRGRKRTGMEAKRFYTRPNDPEPRKAPTARRVQARAEKLVKQAEALGLRREGLTYGEIAGRMGVSDSEVGALLREEFKRLREVNTETAEQIIAVHEERLEKLWKSLQHGIEAGATRAVEVGLKVLERHARLRGLDAPEKRQVQVEFMDLTDDEVMEEARRLRVDLAALVGSVPALLPGESRVPAGLVVFDAASLGLDAESVVTVGQPSEEQEPCGDTTGSPSG